MDDLTTAQSTLNSQPQGTPEKPREKKEAHLNLISTVLMILLMLVLGYVLANIAGWLAAVGVFLRGAFVANPALANVPFDIIIPKGILNPPGDIIIFVISLMAGLFPIVLYLTLRFRYSYIITFYITVVLIISVTWGGANFFNLVHEAKAVKERQLKEFENAQMIKAYLPTSLKDEWTLVNNDIDSGGGMVKVEYGQTEFRQQETDDFDAGHKWITMIEIVSPKTDLKCNNETLLESDKMVTLELPVSDKRWLTNCEELSISGEKAILSGYEQRINPQKVFYSQKEFLMVFDKGDTRIFLSYEQVLKDYLLTTENWSESHLIRVAENLRPIDAQDFKL